MRLRRNWPGDWSATLSSARVRFTGRSNAAGSAPICRSSWGRLRNGSQSTPSLVQRPERPELPGTDPGAAAPQAVRQVDVLPPQQRQAPQQGVAHGLTVTAQRVGSTPRMLHTPINAIKRMTRRQPIFPAALDLTAVSTRQATALTAQLHLQQRTFRDDIQIAHRIEAHSSRLRQTGWQRSRGDSAHALLADSRADHTVWRDLAHRVVAGVGNIDVARGVKRQPARARTGAERQT